MNRYQANSNIFELVINKPNKSKANSKAKLPETIAEKNLSELNKRANQPVYVNKRLTCRLCGEAGHKLLKCPQIEILFEDYNFNKKVVKNPKTGKIVPTLEGCAHCYNPSHTERHCFKLIMKLAKKQAEVNVDLVCLMMEYLHYNKEAIENFRESQLPVENDTEYESNDSDCEYEMAPVDSPYLKKKNAVEFETKTNDTMSVSTQEQETQAELVDAINASFGQICDDLKTQVTMNLSPMFRNDMVVGTIVQMFASTYTTMEIVEMINNQDQMRTKVNEALSLMNSISQVSGL